MIKLLILKIEQIELIRKKFYVSASIGRISKISLIKLLKAIVVIGEKKVRSVLYNTIIEQLFILCKKRSQGLELQLRNVSQDNW